MAFLSYYHGGESLDLYGETIVINSFLGTPSDARRHDDARVTALVSWRGIARKDFSSTFFGTNESKRSLGLNSLLKFGRCRSMKWEASLWCGKCHSSMLILTRAALVVRHDALKSFGQEEYSPFHLKLNKSMSFLAWNRFHELDSKGTTTWCFTRISLVFTSISHPPPPPSLLCAENISYHSK